MNAKTFASPTGVFFTLIRTDGRPVPPIDGLPGAGADDDLGMLLWSEKDAEAMADKQRQEWGVQCRVARLVIGG